MLYFVKNKQIHFMNHSSKIKNYIKLNFLENINDEFIDVILDDTNNKIVFHNIDNTINNYNNTSFLVYHKVYKEHTIKYYILLLGTNKKIRNCGYGKLLLDDFIDHIRNKTKKNITIYINSINDSKQFYINYGFKKLDLIKKNTLFFNYEPYSDINNYHIFYNNYEINI